MGEFAEKALSLPVPLLPTFIQLFMSKTRDLRFDGLKFLLIFLVVLGHLTFKDYGIGVKRMIYSFHMPVFVFLSGFFLPLSQTRDKQIKWLKKTFLIFLCAHISQHILRIMIGFVSSLLNGSAFDLSSFLSWKLLISPGFALWYLVCLIYWRIIVWIIGGNLKDILLLVISLIISILAGFVPLDYDFSFQRAFAFFPFFVLGIVFQKRQVIPQLERIPVIYAIISVIIGLVLARTMTPYLPVHHYVNREDVFLRMIQTLLGMFMCPMIIRISRCRFTEVFAKYGSKTLWIYIGHTYLIILGDRFYHYCGVSFNMFSATLVAIIYCVILIFMANKYQEQKEKRMIVADFPNNTSTERES